MERNNEFQVWRDQKMPKKLPGFSGGRLPGTSKVAKKREEEKGEEEGQEKKVENEVIRGS